MRLQSIRIRGYRSLEDVEVPLEELTALIGPNGSGKSSILAAIRIFFDPSSRISELDFWCGTAGEPCEEITITVTIVGMNSDEKAALDDVVNPEGQLIVSRSFETPGPGNYLVEKPGVPDFSMIRSLPTKHRDHYTVLVESGRFEGLEAAGNKAEVFEAMDAWEKMNPDACVALAQPFEPQRVLEHLTVLYIGAFEDPEGHLRADGDGAVATLLARVLDRSEIEEQLNAVAATASAQSEEVLALAETQLEPFSLAVKASLSRFAPGFTISLAWAPVDVEGPRPRLSVDIVSTDDGPARPLAYQGHGVQRSLMYAALTAQADNPDVDGASVVLLIEEPEAFQHPLSSRVLSRTLRELSQQNYQVAYSTHSPEFIHPDGVEGLRIISRRATEQGPATHVESLSSIKLLKAWQHTFEGADFTEDTVRARLRPHLTAHVLEGLFARRCIIVEGDEDEAFVRGAALRRDLDLDAGGIAIIRANGKTGVPNALTFLLAAGIPCYALLDLDRDKPNVAEQHRAAEHQVQRALGIPEPLEGGAHPTYACWGTNLSQTIREEFGVDRYDRIRQQTAGNFGYARPKDATKVPLVIAELLRQAADEGATSASLEAFADVLESMPELAV